ncbi:MAG: serine hydroxymethyltransferase [Alphaproteobacteria bacterium]|nr:serine hydroxymethyltransferase [Alphaproteobacteria bacterium]
MTQLSLYSRLAQFDPEIAQAIQHELARQQNQIEMIASENFTSLAVMLASGSVMTNKYAEGYPGRRYYGGCEYVDVAENLAIERACQLFNCNFANVQPHAGASANLAVFMALLQPGDTFLGMSLDAGGHLTHGSKVNYSGKWFDVTSYGVNPQTGLIDMDDVRAQALAHKPKLIIAGASAYTRVIDFKGFREIADEVGAMLMVDMAHYAGLIASGVYPSPFPYAHVVTTTTHKTLRGPRGGMILWNDESLTKKFNSAVFPGNQGGPLMHIIAAKAVAFGEALKPEFKTYSQQVVKNAQVLADTLMGKGVKLLSDGTDCHMILVDLSPFGVSGDDVQKSLERAGITCNKNSIPNDPLPPMKTSGVRIGSPAATTRGMKEKEFEQLGEWIFQIIQSQANGGSLAVEQEVALKVQALCKSYPLYPELG